MPRKEKGGSGGESGKTKTPSESEDGTPAKRVDHFVAMKENLALLEQAVELKDDKNLIRRVWRKNTALRKNLSMLDFQTIFLTYVPISCPAYKQMFIGLDAALKRSMEEEQSDSASAAKDDKREEISLEVECYLHIFLIAALLQRNCPKEAKESARLLVERVTLEKRRTMDTFYSKAYHYFVQCNLNELNTIRPQLIAAHRTACLRLNEHGQAALINLVLRSFNEANLVPQAIKFDAKTEFPPSASNNQQIRHLYYMGRMHAIQTDYSTANDCLIRAMRKAPTNTGLGFRVAVYKLAICVQLLMGDTPDRSWFSDRELKVALEPYFLLVKAVRNGSIPEYDAVLGKCSEGFKRDRVFTLMARLRSSVIKTGLRNINLAYSRISFQDIASRLKLGSSTDAELICAKAIRDNIIEARIDSDKGLLVSAEAMDVYSTVEPKSQFNRRIEFCLDIYNSAMKAHRYPPNSHRPRQDQEKEKEGKTDVAELEAGFEDDL